MTTESKPGELVRLRAEVAFLREDRNHLRGELMHLPGMIKRDKLHAAASTVLNWLLEKEAIYIRSGLHRLAANCRAQIDILKDGLAEAEGRSEAPPNEQQRAVLAEYEQVMTEAVPQIIADASRRGALADEARQRTLGPADIEQLLKQTQEEVRPIIERERENEHIPQGLMEFRMR